MSVAERPTVAQFRRSADVEAAPLKDECVLFNQKTNKFFMLNRTMAFIWSRLEQTATPSQISEELQKSFAGVTAEQAHADVELALREMLELELLVLEDV
jgi:hypothetical protein